MRGLTHLAIGVTTGVAAAALAEVPLSVVNLGVAAVSSLAPDLDHHQSRLSRRLSAHFRYVKWGFALAMAGLALYAGLCFSGWAQQGAWGVAALGFLAAFSMEERTVRSIALLLLGLGLVAWGIGEGWHWLWLLGGFVAVSPFLAHRSWTHTLWALGLWYYIGFAAEQQLGYAGIAWLGTAGYASHLLGDSLTKSGVRWFFPLWSRALGYRLIRTGSGQGNATEVLIALLYGVLVFSVFYQPIRLF